jgi:hypothetical protein
MEKRSFDERDSKRVEVVKEKPVKRLTPKTIRIVLLRKKKVNTKGSVTGKMYSFSGAGSILYVDERDAPVLLARGAGGTSCCSGVPVSPYFELV